MQLIMIPNVKEYKQYEFKTNLPKKKKIELEFNGVF